MYYKGRHPVWTWSLLVSNLPWLGALEGAWPLERGQSRLECLLTEHPVIILGSHAFARCVEPQILVATKGIWQPFI